MPDPLPATGPDAVEIERLSPPFREADIHALAGLLIHAVDGGAALSFLAPVPVARAEAWWRKTLAAATDGSIFLVARSGSAIVGTVQLHPAWAPNQPHRADIAKLIVHQSHRGAGLGTRLMQAIESEAGAAGLRLLTLDTRRGDAAERLYHRLGWTRSGIIPGYALNSDGTPHDTVIFYKQVGAVPAPGG